MTFTICKAIEMSLSIGVVVKIFYFIICLFVWGGSYSFFLNAGIPSEISAFMSFLSFIASLAVFFPKVREVLESIVEAVRDLIGFFNG